MALISSLVRYLVVIFQLLLLVILWSSSLAQTQTVDPSHTRYSFSNENAPPHIHFRVFLNHLFLNDEEQWTATLFVHNVFDERGILTVEDSILRQAETATTPRTIGISASWNF